MSPVGLCHPSDTKPMTHKIFSPSIIILVVSSNYFNLIYFGFGFWVVVV